MELNKKLRSKIEKYIYYEDENVLLLHGNSFEILPMFDNIVFELVLTDPPYDFGNRILGGGFYKSGVKGGRKYLKKLKKLNSVKFNPKLFLDMFKYRQGVFFCNKKLLPEYIKHVLKRKMSYDIHFMWKENPIPAKSNHFMSDVEYIVFIKFKKAYFNQHNSIEDYKKVFRTVSKANNLHPAEKPVAVMEKYVRVLCPEGEIVFDPFIGSGATAIASVCNGRKCIGIEKDKKYLDITIQRLQTVTNSFLSIGKSKKGWRPTKSMFGA